MAKFAGLLKYKPIHVLDIPDVYSYMDSELIEELQRSIQEVIDSWINEAKYVTNKIEILN